ncbi:MAG TPA: phosphotransferase [Clostridiales bacterium]|nr:phosphotransferase [Clostridiales bacterium]
METNLTSILSGFGVSDPSSIKQIYRSAWDIDDEYVLKTNKDKNQLKKSIFISRLLLSEEIPVIEYIDTADGKPYVHLDEKYWCLMKKLKGDCFDPYEGDPHDNGLILGKALARLHKALKNIQDKIESSDVDFSHEFSSWIVPEIKKNGVSFKDGVMDSIYAFFSREYKSLPRQLIHRDMHTSNMIFKDGEFSYLDFDMSQRNVRIFDIAYLGCSQLIDNYKDEVRLKQWHEIFRGILQGYNQLLPLSEDELKAVPVLFVFIEVLFTAFFLKIGQPETAESCLKMTNWLFDNMSSLIC